MAEKVKLVAMIPGAGWSEECYCIDCRTCLLELQSFLWMRTAHATDIKICFTCARMRLDDGRWEIENDEHRVAIRCIAALGANWREGRDTRFC